MNRCIDCDEPISARRRRCRACRAEYRAEAARERRANEADKDLRYSDEDVVDFTQGAGNRVPNYDVAPKLEPQRVPDPAEPQDPRVESPAVRAERSQFSMAGIPASLRHDFVRGQRAAAAQSRPGNDSELLEWNDLLAVEERFADGDGRMVDFHPTPQPPRPRTNAIGQSVPRDRGFGR